MYLSLESVGVRYAGARAEHAAVAGVTLGEGETLADALALPDGVRPLAG